MCPLVSAPNRGYADYQRVGNFDTGVLWDEDTGGVQIDITSPVIDVSRYAYMGANIAALQGQPYIILQWYLDAGATIPAARRDLVMDVNITGNAQLRTPNLGPFLQITLSRVTAANYRTLIQVYATNRAYPLDLIPRLPVLIDHQATALGASGNFLAYPSDYYAGPVRVWAFGNQTYQWTATYLNESGVWDVFDQSPVQGANTDVSATTITPFGAWRIQMNNTSAAAGLFYLVATPSTTGAG